MSTAGIPARLLEWIATASHREASDLYLDLTDKRLSVQMRVRGKLLRIAESEHLTDHNISAAFRHRLGIDISTTRRADCFLRIPSEVKSIRVGWISTEYGESWTLRFQEQSIPGSVNEIPPQLIGALQARKPALHLIAGTTGSGKTTTLYRILQFLSPEWGKVITLEDPPEKLLPGFVQTEIDPTCGWTFSHAIGAVLRQDPDLIVVGEIRDEESALCATRAALTGHPVLATIHAGSREDIILRIQSLGIAPWQCDVTRGIHVHQRMEPAICEECEGTGCIHCSMTGRSGVRVAYSISES